MLHVSSERFVELYHLLQVRLAKRLVELSFADKVFYANSGTEANEAAIKFCRKHARLQGSLATSLMAGILNIAPRGFAAALRKAHGHACCTAIRASGLMISPCLLAL